MPKTLPTLGYPSRTEAVSALMAQGLKPQAIAERFGPGFTARDIVSIAGQLSKRKGLRSLKNGQSRTAVIPWVTFTALQPHAHKRGVSVSQLIVEMVDRIAADGIVDAVLDDRGARQ